MSDEIFTQKQLQSHINSLYKRCDKGDQEILELTKKQGDILLAVKQNEIGDLENRTELKEQIEELARSGGKKSGGRSGKIWGILAGGGIGGIIQAIEHQHQQSQ